MKKVHLLLVHVSNILAMCMITFYILDIYNPMMKFIDNTTSKLLLLWFGIVTLVANQIGIWLLRPGKGTGREKRGENNPAAAGEQEKGGRSIDRT